MSEIEARVAVKRCPRCRQLPLFVTEESFLGGADIWNVLHNCPRGLNVSEEGCLSRSDAADAWNWHVEQEPEQSK